MVKIVKKVVKSTQKPTKEQSEMVKQASRRPITFDDDSPEFTYEEMLEMIEKTKNRPKNTQKQVVTLRLSPSTLNKAKAVGKGYTSFLSRLVENAINDKDIVSRSL